ncbi:MAG: zinc-binding dehydrogenase [Spirochaetota bacterium]
MRTESANYDENGKITIKEKEIGDVGPGELLVEGGICGICSWDIATCRSGKKMEVPAPPGHEAVGFVKEMGPGVKGFEVGDIVAGGGFSSLRKIPALASRKIPKTSLSLEHWLAEPVTCVVNGIDHCSVKPGDRIVMIGTGFMGLLMLQGLKKSPADTIIAVDIDDAKLARAKEFGADEVYNRSCAHLAETLAAMEIDTVIETSGSKSGLELAGIIVKKGGTINLFGWLKQTVEFNFSNWHMKGLTVINASPSAAKRELYIPAIRLIANGVFDTSALITHRVPLHSYPELMKTIIAGDATYMKGIVAL